MKPPESAQEEAQNLVTAFPDEETFLLGLLERQLNILHQRSQVVIGFAAVAISTTGFSGRLISSRSSWSPAFGFSCVCSRSNGC